MAAAALIPRSGTSATPCWRSPRTVARGGSAAARRPRARARRRPLRRARGPGRRRRLHAVPHRRDERRSDARARPAAAHARAARRDARVARLVPHARHPPRPALPRLVAPRPSGHALVPRRADRRGRGRDRRVLPDRQGSRRRVLAGRPGADRAARRARRDRDHERAPLRAHARAVDPLRAEPARARAARRRSARSCSGSCSRRSPRTRSSTPTRPPRACSSARLRELAQRGARGAARAVLELRPPDLERDGLAARCASTSSCCAACRRARSSSTLDGGRRGDARRDREVLRIAQEAIHNALRHAGATRVAVRLAAADGLLELEVTDDGAGFDPTDPELRSRRLGLTSMEERARAARRPARDPLGAPATGRRCVWRRRLAEPIRVLVADDHGVVREGLRTFLQLQEGIEVVGEAADGLEAVAEAERLAPDVVLMDLVMPGIDGVEAMRRAARAGRPRPRRRAHELHRRRAAARRRSGPAPPATCSRTSRRRSSSARSAPRTRARRCSTRPRRAASSHAIASRRRARRAAADAARARGARAASPRGLANKRIALELGVSEKTVKTHVGHVLAKLGVTDRTQAALYAVREGLARRSGPRTNGRMAKATGSRRTVASHADRNHHRSLTRPWTRARTHARRAPAGGS